jgi:hydroxymethylglutaryl-CoA lyase
VRRVEATSFVSPSAVPALADAEQLAELLPTYDGIEFSALVAGFGGVKRALAAGMNRLEYVVSASEAHSQANVGRGVEESLALTRDIADAVHGAGGHLEVIVAISFDCPFEGRTSLDKVVDLAGRAAELGADSLCLGDTIGTATPGRTDELVRAVVAAAPHHELGCHFHDTRGNGLASAWSAYQAGVRHFDASIGGLGGCPFAPGASGNIATEELVYLFEDSGIDTGLDLDATVDAARVAEQVVEHPLTSRFLRLKGR